MSCPSCNARAGSGPSTPAARCVTTSGFSGRPCARARIVPEIRRSARAGAGLRSLGRLTTVAIEHSVGLQAPSAGEPGPSRRLIFGIVAVGLFMSSIDATIVATALPAIHTSLRATINWAGWTITIYSLGLVIVLPIAGKISDQFGRRRIFVYG